MIDAQVGSWLDTFSRERRRQTAVDQSSALTMQGDEELDFIVKLIHDHYQTRYAAISIIDRHSQIILVQRGLDISAVPRRTTFCAVTIQQANQVLVVADACNDQRFATLDSVTADPFIRFYAGMPVTDGVGIPIGTICIADTGPCTGSFDPRLLEMMARETERVLLSAKPAYPAPSIQNGQTRNSYPTLV